MFKKTIFVLSGLTVSLLTTSSFGSSVCPSSISKDEMRELMNGKTGGHCTYKAIAPHEASLSKNVKELQNQVLDQLRPGEVFKLVRAKSSTSSSANKEQFCEYENEVGSEVHVLCTEKEPTAAAGSKE